MHDVRMVVAGAVVAVALIVHTALPASAGSVFFKPRQGDTSCHPQAIRDLELFSPRGAQVFHALTDRSMFWPFLTCDNVALGLSTAVHEGVHGLTEQLDGYPLIHGGVVRRPHEVERFMPPRVISGRFSRSNVFVQNYLLPGNASSADTLMYLFDELNAYTHDLHTSVRIRTLPGGEQDVDHRDGLTSLMRFLMHYVDEARSNHAPTWQGLNQANVRTVVRTLWSQAEKTLASACGIPRFGGEDHRYVAEMCDTEKSAALSELIGRRVACHTRCLRGPGDGRAEPRFEIAGAGTAAADVDAGAGPPADKRNNAAGHAAPPVAAHARRALPVTRTPTRWPVVVTRTRTVPVTTVALSADEAAARFASPALAMPRLVAAPILIRSVE